MKQIRQILNGKRDSKTASKQQQQKLARVFKGVFELVGAIPNRSEKGVKDWYDGMEKIVFPTIRGNITLEGRAEYEMKRLISTIRAATPEILSLVSSLSERGDITLTL